MPPVEHLTMIKLGFVPCKPSLNIIPNDLIANLQPTPEKGVFVNLKAIEL